MTYERHISGDVGVVDVPKNDVRTSFLGQGRVVWGFIAYCRWPNWAPKQNFRR